MFVVIELFELETFSVGDHSRGDPLVLLLAILTY